MIRLLLVGLLFLAVYRLGRHVERHAVSSPPETTRTETTDDRAATRGPHRRGRVVRTPTQKRATGRSPCGRGTDPARTVGRGAAFSVSALTTPRRM